MIIKQRLDTLTSLRFFAAAMIVIHHLIGYEVFGLSAPLGRPSNWGQGVSFFFVLSGFILAHVYPKLETWTEICRFWRARIARIWPALVFSFMLAFWMLSLNWDTPIALANLFMVNAWIPHSNYYFSYNSPSWSISTEFFFYLTFPLIIYKWSNNWLVKLVASFLILISMFVASDILQSQKFGDYDDSFTRAGLLYISPVTRIFEFIFGIFLASIWKKNKRDIHWSETRATLYEIGTILVVGGAMYFIPLLGKWIQIKYSELAVSYWLSFSGSMFAFGLLIYVASIRRGRISVWLSHPFLVLLGEISFSLYLLHQILIRYYHANIIGFPHLPNSFSLTIFWIVLLLASYLMWACIEMPCRQLILGNAKKMHGTQIMRQQWREHLNWNKKTKIATIALTFIVSVIYFSMDNSASNYLQRKNVAVTPDSLSFYSSRGDLTMIKLLIEAGVDVNARNSQGGYALIDASWAGEEEIVLKLLEAKASVNAISHEMLTPLSAAIKQKHMNLALLLLKYDANPNLHGSACSTPLMDAVWLGETILVKALLAHGANHSYKCPNNGFTPLKAAAAKEMTDVLQALTHAGANE